MHTWLLWIAALAVLMARWCVISYHTRLLIRGDVLLVFAHPDYEAMFFTPLLHYLQANGIAAHLLCLSTGNYDGKGETRETELYASAAYFGILARSVKIVNHPELQDGMNKVWSLNVIKNIVEDYLQKTGSISTIVTFDGHGVSAHPNHIAVHSAVRLTKAGMLPGLIFLQLHSRNVFAKFIGILSLLPYLTILNPHRSRYDFAVMIPPTHVVRSMAAMERHASQLVWFRYLFVVFSSYTFIAEFRALE